MATSNRELETLQFAVLMCFNREDERLDKCG